MSPQIEQSVRSRMSEPTPDTEITLIVDLNVDDSSTVSGQVNSVGQATTVEEELPFGSMVVTTSESEIQLLYDLDIVNSMEIEGEGRVLSPGNL